VLALNGTQAALDGVTRAALQDIATASEEWSGTLKLNPQDARLVRTAIKALAESWRLHPQGRSLGSGGGSGGSETEAWAEVLAELDLRGRGLVGLPSQPPATLSAAQLYSGYTQGTDLEALWRNWTAAQVLPVDLAVDLRLFNAWPADATRQLQPFFNGSVAAQARGSYGGNGSSSIDLVALGKEAEAWVDAAGAVVVDAVVGTVGAMASSTATAAISTAGAVANATGSVGPAVGGWLSAAGSAVGSAVGSAAGWLSQATMGKANATASATRASAALPSASKGSSSESNYTVRDPALD
jgi:hypothetical protein